jgi:hypothetical protein
MPTHAHEDPLPLPANPSLRHLKDQARDLLRDSKVASLTDAQFRIARRYGFASWPKLKAHVDSLTEIGELKQAIDANDLELVKSMMTRNPALHAAPLGYGKNGPLTWVAECRVPWEPPKPERLAMARWMLENGSDIHQGGDGPLMRAALVGYRVPMMELLLEHGADVNAEWNGYFPIIFAPCETVDAVALRWLLQHGANPNCARAGRKYPVNALDYVIGTYSRSPQLAECIDALLQAGAVSKLANPPVLALLRNHIEELAAMIDAEPAPAHASVPRARVRIDRRPHPHSARSHPAPHRRRIRQPRGSRAAPPSRSRREHPRRCGRKRRRRANSHLPRRHPILELRSPRRQTAPRTRCRSCGSRQTPRTLRKRRRDRRMHPARLRGAVPRQSSRPGKPVCRAFTPIWRSELKPVGARGSDRVISRNSPAV